MGPQSKAVHEVMGIDSHKAENFCCTDKTETFLVKCKNISKEVVQLWQENRVTGWVTLSANFRRKGASPTYHCWCQETKVNALSCGIKISAVLCCGFVTKHACDRQMDGRTDGQVNRSTTLKTASRGKSRKKVQKYITKYILLLR